MDHLVRVLGACEAVTVGAFDLVLGHPRRLVTGPVRNDAACYMAGCNWVSTPGMEHGFICPN